MTLTAREQAIRAKAQPSPGPRGGPGGLVGLRAGVAEAAFRQPDPEAPDRVVDLHPMAWAETWVDRPAHPLRVGVRRISEHHQMSARGEAIKTADRIHPREDHDSKEWLETYNQALMLGCIAHALCKPHNRHETLWNQQAELVPMRLTTAGAERLFDELELVTVIEGPTRQEASSEELYDLGQDLTSGAFWQDMPMARARHIRRLLAFAIELAAEPIVQLTPND